jgi:hypothetical protein
MICVGNDQVIFTGLGVRKCILSRTFAACVRVKIDGIFGDTFLAVV